MFGENCNAKLIKDTEAIVNDYMNSDKARGLRKFSDLTRLNYSVGVSCRFFFCQNESHAASSISAVI